MDTWTSALLWAFLWATRCAYNFKKPSIAYAVDAGHLSSFNRRLVKREASKTDLILTRTELAAEELKDIGVKAPIDVTADCAFTFKTLKEDANILNRNMARIRFRSSRFSTNRFLFVASSDASMGQKGESV